MQQLRKVNPIQDKLLTLCSWFIKLNDQMSFQDIKNDKAELILWDLFFDELLPEHSNLRGDLQYI
jgi:hypothetical protein